MNFKTFRVIVTRKFVDEHGLAAITNLAEVVRAPNARVAALHAGRLASFVCMPPHEVQRVHVEEIEPEAAP